MSGGHSGGGVGAWVQGRPPPFVRTFYLHVYRLRASPRHLCFCLPEQQQTACVCFFCPAVYLQNRRLELFVRRLSFPRVSGRPVNSRGEGSQCRNSSGLALEVAWCQSLYVVSLERLFQPLGHTCPPSLSAACCRTRLVLSGETLCHPNVSSQQRYSKLVPVGSPSFKRCHSSSR